MYLSFRRKNLSDDQLRLRALIKHGGFHLEKGVDFQVLDSELLRLEIPFSPHYKRKFKEKFW